MISKSARTLRSEAQASMRLTKPASSKDDSQSVSTTTSTDGIMSASPASGTSASSVGIKTAPPASSKSALSAGHKNSPPGGSKNSPPGGSKNSPRAISRCIHSNYTIGTAVFVVVLLLVAVTAAVLWFKLQQSGCNVSVSKRECPSGAVTCLTDVCGKRTTWKNTNFRKKILKTHNDFRMLFYLFNARKPYCRNMIKLVWKEELELGALRGLRQICLTKNATLPNPHCMSTYSFDTVSQNLAGVYDEWSRMDSIVNSSTFNWNPTEGRVNTSIASSYDDVDPILASRVRVAWAQTYAIGCAALQMPNSFPGREIYVLCNYSPAGNIPGHKLCDFGEKWRLACPIGTVKEKYPGNYYLCRVENESKLRKALGVEIAG